MNAVPLETLRSDEWADVADVAGEPCLVGRMAEIGLRVGSRVHMLRPGSPCLLEINGCRICFRLGDSVQVFVCPAAGRR